MLKLKLKWILFLRFNLIHMLIVALMLSSCGMNKDISIVEDNKAGDSNPVVGLINQASLCEKSGNYDEALKYYNQAIAINPKSAWAYIYRGLARSELGDNEGAIKDFNQAIAINPKDARVYIGRGNARSKLGDNEGAIKDFNQAIAINPKNAIAYDSRGLARKEIGDKAGAASDYSKYLELLK